MKTIEERANCTNPYDGICGDNFEFERYLGYEEGYKTGATEQKVIDINKACEWLLNSLPTPDWYGSTENFVDEFRKAMEENQ